MTVIVNRIQEEIHKDPCVYNVALWSIKAAWLHKDNYIPRITRPKSKEHVPWIKPLIYVIIQNPTQRRVDPEGAAVVATTRMANFTESKTTIIDIYTNASSDTNGTTIWAYFIK